MEGATEMSISSISYNSKASGMFSQECVGGPKNGSSKTPWWRAVRWNESFYLSWKRGSFDYNQGCTEHAFTGVNSKWAWRAARCTEHVFIGVYSKSTWRAARLRSIMYRSIQQNKTQECNGAHYVLCQSQEWWWSQLWTHLDHRSVLEVPVRSSSFL
jgi:hypothetical protein